MSITARRRPADHGWFTSSRSNNGNQCVEVRFEGDAVQIRDSKFRRNPMNRGLDEPIITVPASVWNAFLDCLLAQRPHPSLTTQHAADGATTLRHGSTALHFTPAEWEAFVAGVRDDEFACV
ncbi:DUF397 domain-containing protein [Nocardia ignorata]|uniref:Uncharacterized protein DUF397 n=1 Tax=Nocardia ignorata TaxID=145285 RepID=A0A4V3CN38_NOCIG|nr:DUF397 domain-containing protein [Nocardia ignorata]TDP32552.1 uncharacterized protein DUF397 [Nocardia ignorata]